MSGFLSKLFPSLPKPISVTPDPGIPGNSPPPVVTPPVDALPWLDWMYNNLGQPMTTGEQASDFEKMVFDHTDDSEVRDTGIEASGCAATACAALELSGYSSPHSAAAVSFATYGIQSDLRRGCIIVFKWSSGGHHVGFCESTNEDGTFQLIAGNQGSPAYLCIETFSQASVIAKRWPSKL